MALYSPNLVGWWFCISWLQRDCRLVLLLQSDSSAGRCGTISVIWLYISYDNLSRLLLFDTRLKYIIEILEPGEKEYV
jgi:hypothetical protein